MHRLQTRDSRDLKTDASQADKLQTLIGAAKVEGVEPIWTSLFAKVRKSGAKDMLDGF